MSAPGYWMDETGGLLSPAVERYLTNDELRNGDIPLNPGLQGVKILELRLRRTLNQDPDLL